MAREKCVLAYSGGLDTSVCIQWLINERDLDVITLLVDVGQDCADLEFARQKALNCGAIESIVMDVRDEFCEDMCCKAIAANGLYENKYPLLSALSRPLISAKLVEVAHKYGATYIAHGCTGKGNDQVRFEVSVQALDPDLKVIAPVRVWDLHTRPQEIAFAEAHGIPVAAKNGKPYSIDDNLWGRAIECGVLEDPWNEPPADIWETTADLADCPDTPEDVIVGFEGGKPCSLDGEKMSVQDVIVKLDAIAGRNGYGRLDQIENRLVGIKSRECYEVPGGLALITAHKALEDLCLERELLHYKLGLEHKWAELVYYGLWFSPLKKALDAFFASTQTLVTGEVKLRFIKGTCTVVGRRSEYSLYDYNLATYDEGDTFNRDSAAGFIEQWGLPSKVWAKHRKDTGNEGTI
ncbi:MAG: argininosuccinate synthase [Coriobacteriaceae bacterium]|nr:argininosuccinate synthase [Coriobacteriaceae bacterium]MDD7111272.1 argininosuccinate synthase [Coriobacteriaceae bacterium]MDY5808795.1 argininosuccinate synthase [Coriobacteriales bacterium]